MEDSMTDSVQVIKAKVHSYIKKCILPPHGFELPHATKEQIEILLRENIVEMVPGPGVRYRAPAKDHFERQALLWWDDTIDKTDPYTSLYRKVIGTKKNRIEFITAHPLVEVSHKFAEWAEKIGYIKRNKWVALMEDESEKDLGYVSFSVLTWQDIIHKVLKEHGSQPVHEIRDIIMASTEENPLPSVMYPSCYSYQLMGLDKITHMLKKDSSLLAEKRNGLWYYSCKPQDEIEQGNEKETSP
jgi:hypothetical protein